MKIMMSRASSCIVYQHSRTSSSFFQKQHAVPHLEGTRGAAAPAGLQFRGPAIGGSGYLVIGL